LFAHVAPTSIEPYRQGSSTGTIPSFNEPEKRVYGEILLYRREAVRRKGDVACVLLLGAEDGRARSWVGGLVGDGDCGVDRGFQGGGDQASERQEE
jgi:hypothetical protein